MSERHDDGIDLGLVPGDAEARGPGYREITETLIGDIRAGCWTVGGQLPTEMALTTRFGVSRNTIRESLRELDIRGYIRRRRGTRSILIAIDPVDSFVNSVRSIDELLQYSRRTISRLISVDMVVASAPLVARLGVAEGTRWLRAQILRMPRQGNAPIGFSEIYINERFAAVADRLGESRPVYQLIEDQFGVAYRRVEQLVEARAASVAVAGLLGVAAGSPLLAVRTEFVTDAGEIAEIGFGHFPANRYRMEIMLERGNAASSGDREDRP